MNIVIITGASSGIGREFASQLDPLLHRTDEIWLIARRKDRMEALSRGLLMKTRIFATDITDSAQIDLLAAELSRRQAKIRLLVNCAGFGIMGEFASLDVEEQLEMVDVNCKALTRLTHVCIPYLKNGGRIIQLASSAAFLPQKNFAVYAATKSYVLSLSRALNEELRGRRITVTAVCPGPVDTEFFERAERYAKTLSFKKYIMADVRSVVGKALQDSYARKSLSVYGPPIKAFLLLTKLLPHSLILRIMRLLK